MVSSTRVIATTNDESRIPGAVPGFPCLKSAKASIGSETFFLYSNRLREKKIWPISENRIKHIR
jgi:hypothetical protein